MIASIMIPLQADAQAEEIPASLDIDTNHPLAVSVDADFQHEKPLQIAPASTSPHLIEDPFRLADVDLQIPRGTCWPVSCANFGGSLVCVVGRVGTGKTALLDGMIREIKRTRGQVIFGGSVAYGGSYLHLRMSASPS